MPFSNFENHSRSPDAESSLIGVCTKELLLVVAHSSAAAHFLCLEPFQSRLLLIRPLTELFKTAFDCSVDTELI